MRYVLVDYMHLAHRCIVAQPLSATVVVNGQVDVKDTTIPSYTIKWIFGYSGKGLFHTGVFFEGGSDFRKNHFAGGKGTVDGKGYKGSRAENKGSFYEGIDLAREIMLKGGVSLYRAQGYEADDLIYAAIKKIKETDTTTPIDVVTNDSDLLPLVDEQVSVYIRGTRQFSEDGCPEHRLYYQVTPRTWEEYLSYTSAYKGYTIPYNSMLLFKMIRGDKSDNVSAAVSRCGKVKYSKIMEEMKTAGVDFPNVFRYGVDFDEVMRPELTKKPWFTDEELEAMKFIYQGIGLRSVNLYLPKQIDRGYLQQYLDLLRINLPK